ncbi:MAG: V-type ATP synthase subunit F [Desulfuromonadales bacterium]|nr:V-type ATP synthase subunit F [Desulfuromonadales bacterium]
MKEILFLTDADAVPGFALTGVRQQAPDPGQVWEALLAACDDPQVGVIVIDARLLTEVDEKRLAVLGDTWPGVIVTLPAPAGTPGPVEDDLQRLVRRALGYHVRLET